MSDDHTPTSAPASALAGPGLWRHCLECSGLAAGGAMVLAVALPASVATWFLVTCGGVLAMGLLYVPLAMTGSVAVAVYLCAWGAALTAWLAIARTVGPWHAPVLAGLVIPCLVLAMLGPVAIGHHLTSLDRDEKARLAARNERELRRWKALFARLGVDGTEILDVIEHPDGREVHGRFGKVTEDGPRPGTISDLQGITDLIAQHKRSGVVTVQELPKAEFIVHVNERTGPRDIVYLPAENHLLTVNRPLGLAIRQTDGREWALKLREINVLLAGVTGSGKSNVLNVFIAQLARCVDVVIFMIDLKGGRAARPWMVPWIQGFTARPVIDWLATDREEANLMLEALWAAREARSRSGAGGEKITPSADLPAILLLCDEGAVLLGHGTRDDGISNDKMAKRGMQLAETGRSEAINLILAAVRANVETLGNTGFKAMSRARIGMAVVDRNDGQSIFPDDPAAAKTLSRITDPGSGLAKVFRDVSPPLHFYRVTDGNPDPETGQPTKDRITPVALWAGDHSTPQLDDLTMTAMGDAYAQRWTREHGEALKREWGAGAGVKPPLDPGENEDLQRIAHLDFDPEAPIDPRRARMREILIERKWQGATVARLTNHLAKEGLTTPRETIHRWLADDKKAGMVRSSGKPHHRWIWVFAEDELSGTG